MINKFGDLGLGGRTIPDDVGPRGFFGSVPEEVGLGRLSTLGLTGSFLILGGTTPDGLELSALTTFAPSTLFSIIGFVFPGLSGRVPEEVGRIGFVKLVEGGFVTAGEVKLPFGFFGKY